VKILLLRSAIKDLVSGREFYESQGDGLGEYFEEASCGLHRDGVRPGTAAQIPSRLPLVLVAL